MHGGAKAFLGPEPQQTMKEPAEPPSHYLESSQTGEALWDFSPSEPPDNCSCVSDLG